MYLITWTFGGKQEIVYQNLNVQLVQKKLQELKKDPNFNKGILQLRTNKGLEFKRIL